MIDIDDRYRAIRRRLEKLTTVELFRIIDNTDKICLDTFNFDRREKTYCPLALALNLHNTVSNPTDETITNEISKRFWPVNVLKGLDGEFYRNDRLKDILLLTLAIIRSRA
jgi:hypothetical protein